MKKYFIKKADVAAQFGTLVPHVKSIYPCCAACSGYRPMATQDGYVISTDMTKNELKKAGIMVSAIN